MVDLGHQCLGGVTSMVLIVVLMAEMMDGMASGFDTFELLSSKSTHKPPLLSVWKHDIFECQLKGLRSPFGINTKGCNHRLS